MRVALQALLVAALSSYGCSSEPDAAPEPGTRHESEVLLEPSAPVDPLEVEPSGRTLSGVFAEDPPRPPSAAGTWVFTDEGEFSRERPGAEGRDGGSYTIDAAGRLVLYVERRGGERLGTAERRIYALTGDPAAGAVSVTAPEGWSVRLVRTGDVASASDTR
jgi:hypothetical protein